MVEHATSAAHRGLVFLRDEIDEWVNELAGAPVGNGLGTPPLIIALPQFPDATVWARLWVRLPPADN